MDDKSKALAPSPDWRAWSYNSRIIWLDPDEFESRERKPDGFPITRHVDREMRACLCPLKSFGRESPATALHRQASFGHRWPSPLRLVVTFSLEPSRKSSEPSQ